MEKAVEKVTYEIYVKSFYDSNNDGIGDLGGVIIKLNYLANLGVDAIMLDNILVGDTNGCEDFQALNPIFGDLAQFDELVKKAHELNIEVGIKFSINHVAISHPWFKAALAGDKLYEDYFIVAQYQEANTDYLMENWHQLGQTQKAYLSLTTADYADLDWRNPVIMCEFSNIFNFWLTHGVSIFQLQDVELIGKSLNYQGVDTMMRIVENSQVAAEYLDLLDDKIFRHHPDMLIIIEHLAHASTRMSFKKIWAKPNFVTYSDTHLLIDYQKDDRWTLVPYDFDDLRHVIHSGGVARQEVVRQAALFWNNPEQSRALNRFILQPEYYKDGAKLLALMLLAGRGIPLIYMGEEIGMEDPNYTDISEYVGRETHQAYEKLLAKGYTKERAFAVVRNHSSDNAKIPMQWEMSEFGGFSNVEPWLTPGEYATTNVNYEIEKDDSIFNFYKDMIQLRKRAKSLQYGEYQPAYEQTPELFAFIRHYNNENLLVLAHFGEAETLIELPAEAKNCQVLISNYFTTELTQRYRLRPYEGLIIKY